MKTIKKSIAVILTVLMAISMMPITAFAIDVQCPNCGSYDTSGYGTNYYCFNCDSDFTPSFNGPPCQYCNSTNTYQEYGEYYHCLNCDERFSWTDPSDTVEGDGSEYDPYLVGSYSSFKRVCNDWYEDDPVYIKLKDDITYGDAQLNIYCNVNLDLDNYDMGANEYEMFSIIGHTLNVTGNTGSISYLQADGATVNLNSGEIKRMRVEGSTFVMNGGSVSDDLNCYGNSTITINGGTVNSIFTDDNSALTINDVTQTSTFLINEDSDVTIYDGSFRDLTLYDEGCHCTVNGGTFTYGTSTVYGGTLEVTDGDFSGPYGGILNRGGTVEISGGNFGYMLNNSGTTELSGGNFEKTNDYGDDEQGYLENLTAPGFMVTEGQTYFTVVPSHTITWKSDENTVIDITEVEVGQTPTHAAPADYEDANYTYTFAGWTPEVVAATQDATYTAQFTQAAKFSVFVKKLTGGTITVSNVTGLTTASQLKDLLVTETGVPASAMRLIYAGKQLADDKTLGEYNIQNDSTIHLIISTYTITWKSDEATIIDTTNVTYGATPTHAAPADYEDENYTYTFAGWTPEVVAVTGAATYTATYTATPKAPAEPNNGASITVGETISENFYLDDDFYAETAYVAFTYNHNSDVSQTANVSTDVMAMTSLDDATDGRKKFSVTQAPAQATEPVTINVYANAEDAQAGTNAIDTINYSVYTYCRDIIENYTGEKAEEMKELAKSTLDYAAAAQTYFNYNTGDMATKDATGDFYNNVAGADLSTVAGVGAAPTCIKRVSVVVKSDLEINLLSNAPLTVEGAGIAATKGTENFAVSTYQNGDYYVLHIAGIEAANMGKVITVETDKGDLVMTANSIIKMLAASGDTNLETLAKAMYLYGAAASAYFD